MIDLPVIIQFLGDVVTEIYGTPDNVVIKHLTAGASVDEFTLDWINQARKDQQTLAENSRARAVITGGDVKYSKKMSDEGKVLIKVDNPKLAIAKIGNFFFVEKVKPGVDPSSRIHSDADIGKNIYAGPNACIGKCDIGDNVIIHANVVIYDGVRIGSNVIVRAGAVLGDEGFGFERDYDRKWFRFPQIGGLIIDDNVEIGANTCINRGALSDTIIGYGTKINNLCHIAHNVKIGRNVIVTAQVNISGSTLIEDDVWVGPNASFRGHQKVGKGATIGAGAVVTKDVPAGETWVGNPAKKMAD